MFSAKKVALAVLAFAATPFAMAQSNGTTVMTSIQTEATALITAGYALLAVIVVAVIGMKLVKKIASRAS